MATSLIMVDMVRGGVAMLHITHRLLSIQDLVQNLTVSAMGILNACLATKRD